MAEALVSGALKQLGSIMADELVKEGRLVVGVDEEVKTLESNLTTIQAVLADAETRQVNEATVRVWLGKLREVAYDIEDLLDDWEAAKDMPGDERLERKVCSFLWSLMSLIPCFCCERVSLHRNISKKIKELKERLDRFAKEKDQFKFVQRESNPPIERPMTISMIDTTGVKGRDEDKNRLVNMLLSEPSDGDGSDLRVLSLVGTGGIGKTTLAQFAFNNDRVDEYFDKKIWVCVSDPFNETRVAKAILESLSGDTQNLTTLEILLQKIREKIEGKKILLILDDVWEEKPDKWNELKIPLTNALPGSKVLVTTRNEKVAGVMGCNNDDILKVGILSDDECWSIVSKIAFSGRRNAQHNDLEAIGREISKKCKGLPLAAKAIGGILHFREDREEWQSILDSEIWKLEEAQREVFPVLKLSYYDLPPVLKRCFSYCAIFPKDYVINKNELIELWMAQGFLMENQSGKLEITGENYFRNLAKRYLFQDFEYDGGQRIIRCKMHDIVHDFAQESVAGGECLIEQVNDRAESNIGFLSSKVRHLRLDCTSYGRASSFNSFDPIKKLRSLLISGLPLTTKELSRLFSESTRVRSLRLRHCDVAEIPPSIRKLVRLRWLDLFGNMEFKQLPETLCELHSLQTIDVTWCRNLKHLPLGIGKLLNLRHLHNIGGPSRLPKEIGQLIGLRTLEEVYVGCDDDDAFSLGDLKNLNQLRGSLEIIGLGAYSGQMGEARHAELKQKEHITHLTLMFTQKPGITGNEELQLLEALEPSPNLEILRIEGYSGTTFPGWMVSLTNLRSISLRDCELCEHLPSLGELPCLETLHLLRMRGLKKVGKELLGIETQIGESKSEISASSASSSSSPVVVAFPKLTKLIFLGMFKWEEWEDYHNDNYDGTTKPPPIIIMPSLLSLEIKICPRLKALPDYILQNTTLRTLEIGRSDLLKERYKETGEDWSKISHIPHVAFW